MTQPLSERHASPGAASAGPLLQVNDLCVSFPGVAGGRSHAIRHVSLAIHARKTLAVVGESGSGKSLTALSVLRLLPPAARIYRGSIEFNGVDLLSLSPRQMLRVRGGEIAMIFQEPMTSLNPVFSVGEQIIEAVMLHQRASHRQARAAAVEALHEVGMPGAANRLNDYPHHFSGGMRQRVMIAMALACRPKLLLADEPTTALDVTVQVQILSLLKQIQESRGLGIMLITHDLGLVEHHADDVCVMYAGRVMEYGPVREVHSKPLHPYTRALLACRPSMRERVPRLRTVPEIIGNREEFAPVRLADGTAVPWWTGSDHMDTDTGSVMRMVSPGHWLACKENPRA